MFAIAHQALVDMAQDVSGYEAVARRPDKFCHGFGVYQLDLQFFHTEPDYFLKREYEQFDRSLEHCVRELKTALGKLGGATRSTLTDQESAMVGIAYNTGRYTPSKGLKQGYFDGKRYYGEAILDYVRQAHTVAATGASPTLHPPRPGRRCSRHRAPSRPPVPPSGSPARDAMLRLRREPRISTPPQANVVGNLPAGHEVRAITGTKVNGFIEVETSLSGALLRGFASAKFLEPVATPADHPPVVPTRSPPSSGIVAAALPRKPGTVTRRRDPASAQSLNENGQPTRTGTTPDELRTQLAAIADWLEVDDPSHLRYQPHDGLTFCNVYAHDYCHLAGVYLPRVWWSAQAQLRLAAGDAVQPLIGNTRLRGAGQRPVPLAARLRAGLRLAADGHAGEAAGRGGPGRHRADRRAAQGGWPLRPHRRGRARDGRPAGPPQRRRRGDRAAAKPGGLQQLPLRHRQAKLVERGTVRRERLLVARLA